MSMKVYEVANILHKDSMKTLEDFQEMGQKVRRLDDDIPDEYIDRLARQYGRRGFVLPFMSKEFFMANKRDFSQEELIRLIPDFSAGNRMSKRQAGVTIWLMNELQGKSMPEFAEVKLSKLSKAYRALELMGNDDQALVKTDGSAQMYLIPGKKQNEQKCRLCFGMENVLDICLDPGECRILLYINGKYYYDQAEWININDIFYLNMDAYLNSKAVKLPGDGLFNDTYDLKKAAGYVFPCRNGFALQRGRQCRLFFDKDRIRLCHGNITTIMWEAPMSHMTINGRASVRVLVNELMSQCGEASSQVTFEFLEGLNAVFLDLHDRYKDEYLKKKKPRKKSRKMISKKETVQQEPQLFPHVYVITGKGFLECDLNSDSMCEFIGRIKKSQNL